MFQSMPIPSPFSVLIFPSKFIYSFVVNLLSLLTTCFKCMGVGPCIGSLLGALSLKKNDNPSSTNRLFFSSSSGLSETSLAPPHKCWDSEKLYLRLVSPMKSHKLISLTGFTATLFLHDYIPQAFDPINYFKISLFSFCVSFGFFAFSLSFFFASLSFFWRGEGKDSWI